MTDQQRGAYPRSSRPARSQCRKAACIPRSCRNRASASCPRSNRSRPNREDTPAAIVYKATWPEQKVLRCTVGTLEQTAREADVTKTALIVVGEVLDGTYERSKLYDPTFTTEFRQASCSKKELGQTGENQSKEMRQEAEGQSK